MSSGFETYLKQFLVIQPGDWPAQFFCRQLVYQSLHQQSNAHKVSQESSPSISVVNENLLPVTSLIPTMGPLHISLNSREHVFETFKPFSKPSTAIFFQIANWLRNLNPGELICFWKQCMGVGP